MSRFLPNPEEQPLFGSAERRIDMSTTNQNRQRFIHPRVAILLSVALAILGLFVLRLWDLQIVHVTDFRAQADQNRFRLEAIDAPRGIIYDRNGQPLVRNAPSFEVQIIPAYLPDSQAAEMNVYRHLAKMLDMPVEVLPVMTSTIVPLGHGAVSVIDAMQFVYAQFKEKLDATPGVKDIVDEVRGIAPYSPVTIKSGVDRNVALQIAEESSGLPGVRVHVASVREYMSGTVTSDILGYMRRISPDDLAALPPDEYNANTDRIGAVGIEGEFEDVLRGAKGRRYVEEDVVGREIRVVGETDPAVPGENVYLTIDFGLQRMAPQALQD